MKLKSLLDLTLGEILEKYCLLMSLECDYIYGVATNEAVSEIWDKYDLSDEPSIVPEFLIRFDLFVELQDSENTKDILTVADIERIIDNLGLADNLKGENE